MPFVSQPYMARLSADKQRSHASAHVSIGYHPETSDNLHIPQDDRYAGMYVLGVQGSGKSGLLQNMIHADMEKGHAVIVIDPHGDLTQSCLNQVPAERIQDAFLLDVEDEDFPFGVNVFPTHKPKTAMERNQTVERILHIFEVLWHEVTTQQYVPLYLPQAVKVFVDNPGKTLADMLRFFQDDGFRSNLLSSVTDPSIREFWHTEYDRLSKSERDTKIRALTNRLHMLFTGNSLVRNIMGQPDSKINFRQAIEAKQIIFIKLPTTAPHIARLVGTILLTQIQEAIFSFADTLVAQRSGVSLYADEFQQFATADFAKLLTEGRKFGARVTIAHQYRNQLPSFLQDLTMTARTKVCFQTTPEDGREMAHFFPSNEATVRPDDIEDHPVNFLLARPPDEPVMQRFIETYLRPLMGHKRGNRVEIYQSGAPSIGDIMNGGRGPNPRIADPTPFLDNLLYQAMRTGDASLPIAPEIVRGFANCGRGFYKQAMGLSNSDPLLSADAKFPRHLVVETVGGDLRWTRRPEGGTEQMYHFVFHLRLVMQRLAEQPIGKATTLTTADTGKMLTALPRRAAFVRTGDTVGVIYTHDTPPALSRWDLSDRTAYIKDHTREVYCHPRAEVERLFLAPGSSQPPDVQPVSRWEEVE